MRLWRRLEAVERKDCVPLKDLEMANIFAYMLPKAEILKLEALTKSVEKSKISQAKKLETGERDWRLDGTPML
eukprot:1285293-Lingulodinium_polyedra.AAC.1